jgi:glycosyltransferase involved in cell wall biosynthesis
VTSQMIVVPSWTEAFPLVIPEAMAAGLPVIATAVGAIPDFVKEGEDGFLVATRNPPELADRICRLLDDEVLRRRISQRVRARAPREFAIDIGCGKVAEVVMDMLGNTPTAKPDVMRDNMQARAADFRRYATASARNYRDRRDS